MIDPDELASLHEGAHGAVSCALGIRLAELSIDGGGGLCVHDEPHGIEPRTHLRILVAGSLAEILAIGPARAPFWWRPGSGTDRDLARQALAELHGEEPHPGSEQHASELLHAISDARRVLQDEVEFHRALASRLRRAGRMDGGTIHRLWRERWRPVGAAGW